MTQRPAPRRGASSGTAWPRHHGRPGDGQECVSPASMVSRPASLALRVLGKGLSPICNSTTSLLRALSLRATARTSKAVSAERPWAKALRGAWLMVERSEVRDQRPEGKSPPARVLVCLSYDKSSALGHHPALGIVDF